MEKLTTGKTVHVVRGRLGDFTYYSVKEMYDDWRVAFLAKEYAEPWKTYRTERGAEKRAAFISRVLNYPITYVSSEEDWQNQ